MAFTIKIEHSESKQAKNLIQYLKSLTQKKEYDFLQVLENEEPGLTVEQKKELDKRYEHYLKHHQEYKDWDDIKHTNTQK